MGIFSWFRSRFTWYRSNVPAGQPGPPRSLLAQPGHDSPRSAAIKKAAAADVARIEQDDKYFGSDSPASQDEL
ncbi:MAG TPA: hypothetical protein VF070_27685 [Streptosporangiaceae bacterium]